MVKTILVIDDEVEICETLSQTLEALGFVVYKTTNVLEVPALLKNKIDLVISDMRMPIKSGLKLLAEAKASGIIMPHWVFITGQDISEFEKEARALGAADFIEKPFTSAQIRKVITKLTLAKAS